ncbi:hypothetical protein D3C72_2506240 [compost metagenome]
MAVVRSQVTTARVMHEPMDWARAVDGFLPNWRTMSRSDRMPMTASPVPTMTMAPILWLLSMSTASASVSLSRRV